jgi:ferredoxin-type protein NapH
MFLFIIPIVLLGNAFCSWICPIGTIIDSFDKGIEKFSPKIEANRNKRRLKLMQKKQSEYEDNGKNLLCPSCPVGKMPPTRYGNLANGVMASVFVGAAVLKLPVFCVVCPMGIATRGYRHLRTMASITGKYLPLILEFWSIPIVAVLLSLRERRFWCKKLCPLGALLRGAGALNPLIKPRVEEKKCIMKGCPEDCEEGHLDLCLICRSIDDKKCEKVCPMDINLADHGSLNRCTKCLECYIVCDYNAVKIDLLSKPEVFRIGFFTRLRTRKRKDQVKQIENRSDAAEN